MAYEIHIGEVTNNKDTEEKRGRLMVKFENILNDEEFPDWVEPTFPFAGKDCGFFFVPPVGAAVECELHKGEGGDDSIDTPEIRWRAALYNSADSIPEEFKDHYPNAVGIKTVKGHLFMMDDEDGSEMIKLLNYKKEQFIELDSDGSIVCKTKNGHILVLDEKNDKVSLRYKDTDVITINSSGIFLGSESAAEHMVLGDLWKAMMDTILTDLATHIHPTGVGPSGPPATASVYTGEKAKTAATISDFITGQKAKP